jgi:hypothetical protein
MQALVLKMKLYMMVWFVITRWQSEVLHSMELMSW